MTDQSGTRQESSKGTFDMSVCMEMMGEMSSQGRCSCGCGEMLSDVKPEGEIPEEWRSMMGKMMDNCFGGGDKKVDVAEEVVEET